ncbi:hypothetical protein [Stigmatella aurantiaca]|uniref:Conserved uncharacterized protein n=2 Tax=Stigmatella aurantiaca (strain DW4/3-1) TaxID=378806 RepID=E3FIE8_STIAD|nr:hypothetical protein [Stigmatella aurantiaca]ADO74109.1 conserved uncharacterized protein [Stigmatella aurantiaca DW4/3-1]
MKRHATLWGAVTLLAAMPALAQDRGRTDGPEGSEYGKGGYEDLHGGRFSLEFNWGAAINAEEPPRGAPEGPPLFLGLTASLWGDDWYQLDFSGSYVLDGGRLNLMVGPRFRTYGYPLSFHLGLRAGAIYMPEIGTRFGLSPIVGADVLVGSGDSLLLGLSYSPDIPLPTNIDGGDITHRLFMSVGYRF